MSWSIPIIGAYDTQGASCLLIGYYLLGRNYLPAVHLFDALTIARVKRTKGLACIVGSLMVFYVCSNKYMATHLVAIKL